ncbi:M23 family metallopeptidase [Terrimonas sp. NA20]|uniref:M23 family metallopeptidase n=1 Tax=Terrimonas ginsenosidimutans TaxID=2908004 RepID=A0ABS9KQ62_9BACT|nr:M23 family metallopeptidase [Terrimonas ginsenosidimutans]MCG2614440.1 M23 family metallopeptidase [Terrimonas ginsenosidimutans]
MIRCITTTVACLLLFQGLTFSQTPSYPKGYFRWPLNLNPEIVANLGELRSNHWHMGLDMRTNQVVNQMVYAAADGYVAYIGVRPLSFGRFIIINHPNGLSTLYAHLNDFAPDIEKYVTEQQYKQQSWPVELEIPATLFPVKKGTFISYSGTTGGSQGPHVHFEIRDTKSGKCLNPMMFGFPLTDNVPPSITRLVMYNREGPVFYTKPAFFPVKKIATGYVPSQAGVIKTTNSKISFAIQAIDRISGSSNEDGFYSAFLYLDNKLVNGFVLDSIGYDQTRYLNAQVDYTLRFNGGPWVQHLSRLPGNVGNVYRPQWEEGVIRLEDTLVHAVRIEVKDANQNLSVLNFSVQRKIVPPSDKITPAKPFVPNYVNIFEQPDFQMYLPEKAIYDTVYPNYHRAASNATNAVSAIHQISNPSIPVEGKIRVSIKPDRSVPANWRNKLIIQRTYRNSQDNRLASWNNEWVSAEFGDFGNYQVIADLTPPALSELGKGDTINLSGAKRIAFTPTDNMGIKSFRAELNGQWLRFTNDKGRTWIYEFDERVPYGVYQLKVEVQDIVGNTTTKTWWFKRAAYTPPPPKKKATKARSKKVVKKKK